MSRRGENIYKRKDGRWEGRYVRERRSDGSIHYGYVYAKTYKEVLRKLIPLKKESIFTYVSSDGRSVSNWTNEWLNEQKQLLKLSTFTTYQYKLRKYVLPKIGNTKLIDLDRTDIQNLIDSLKNENKLSPSTIENIFRILSKVLSKAHKRGYLSKEICNDIVLPKKKKTKIRALSQEEQRSLEKAAISDSFGLPAILALHTGLRIGELSALTWENIDFKNQVLYVEHTYQRMTTSTESGKTSLILDDAKSSSSQRMVPLSDTLTAALMKEKEFQQGDFVFMRNDRPMEPRLINYHFKKIVEKSGISDTHFHQLRHTFATRCMEVNGDIVSISKILGHSSPKTTLDIYVDSLDQQRKKIISDMEKLVKL